MNVEVGLHKIRGCECKVLTRIAVQSCVCVGVLKH